jgi:hypothetical protein
MMAPLLLAVLTIPAQGPTAPPPPKPDVVLLFNEAALQAIRTARTPPPAAARHLAIVHIAIHDAVAAVEPRYHSYRFSAKSEGPASAATAAAVAAHRVLIELYPTQVEALDTALDEALASVPDDDGKELGMRVGQTIAEQVLRWRQRDGSQQRVAHVARFGAGEWRPTPPRFLPPLLPQWRYVTPFGVRRISAFLPSDPPGLGSIEYQTDLAEVRTLGERRSTTRSDEETEIARFWNDDEGTVTPPGHWNRIAQQAARSRRLDLVDNARVFALLNISLADAGILCWECKFRYALWRPVTAIREAERDGDPGWTPLLTTPPFPSYPSGHSTFSGAAAAALSAALGTDEVVIRIRSDGLPGVTRSFSGFRAAAEEAGRSRIYGGIHYQFDNSEGLACGKALAEKIARTLLLPLTSDEKNPLPGRP